MRKFTRVENGSNAMTSAAQFAGSVTALTGAKSTDKVTILGRGAIDLLLALAEQGFVAVSCRGIARGPHLPTDTADVVLAPAIASETELAAACEEAKRSLKQDGVFLAKIARVAMASRATLRRLSDVLAGQGFAVSTKRGDFLFCRKLSS
jgi:hypothetical protein